MNAVSEPDLLTVPEVATFLRTSPKAVYDMVERGSLPGVVRLGRRVLVRRVDLLRHVGLLPSRASNGSLAKAG
jgi:excisionase family DNA binding protein